MPERYQVLNPKGEIIGEFNTLGGCNDIIQDAASHYIQGAIFHIAEVVQSVSLNMTVIKYDK